MEAHGLVKGHFTNRNMKTIEEGQERREKCIPWVLALAGLGM